MDGVDQNLGRLCAFLQEQQNDRNNVPMLVHEKEQ